MMNVQSDETFIKHADMYLHIFFYRYFIFKAVKNNNNRYICLNIEKTLVSLVNWSVGLSIVGWSVGCIVE